MIEHKPECPASWGVGEMPEGPCTFCEMLSACEERAFAESLGALNRVTEERDRARAIAVALEQEIDQCTEGYFFHQSVQGITLHYKK